MQLWSIRLWPTFCGPSLSIEKTVSCIFQIGHDTEVSSTRNDRRCQWSNVGRYETPSYDHKVDLLMNGVAARPSEFWSRYCGRRTTDRWKTVRVSNSTDSV